MGKKIFRANSENYRKLRDLALNAKTIKVTHSPTGHLTALDGSDMPLYDIFLNNKKTGLITKRLYKWLVDAKILKEDTNMYERGDLINYRQFGDRKDCQNQSEWTFFGELSREEVDAELRHQFGADGDPEFVPYESFNDMRYDDIDDGVVTIATITEWV